MLAPPPSIPFGEKQQRGWTEVKKRMEKTSIISKGTSEERGQRFSKNPEAKFTWGQRVLVL
jgi:hypothetical protein